MRNALIDILLNYKKNHLKKRGSLSLFCVFIIFSGFEFFTY